MKRCSTSLEKCKSKPQWDITSHMSEWLLSKRPQITNVGEDVEKREPLYTVGGNVKLVQPLLKMVWSFLKKAKNRNTIWSSNSIPGYISEENENTNSKRYYTCTPMFLAGLFTIAKIWKQPKCPSTDEWVKNVYLYKYTLEFYSAIKKNKILPFTTGMDLEGFMLSEISQKDKYRMKSLICGI